MTANLTKSLRSKTSACTILVIVVAVAVTALLTSGMFKSGASSYALVHDGDGNTTAIALDQPAGASERTTIVTSLGTNVVEVGEYGVHVVEADCKNHDCVKQGIIAVQGQQIVCLPHRLWIEVTSDPSQAGDSSAEEVAAQQYDAVGR